MTLQDGDRLITVPGPVRTDPAQTDRTVDLVFLAVKATRIDAAAEWLASLGGPETVICVLQNGVEQLERVTLHSRRGRIVPAVVWFPAQAQSDGSVLLRGDMRLSLPDTSASRVVAEALQGTRCSVDLAANFSALAWRKLLQNAVAGLMVLTHRRSGMFGRPLEWDIRNGVVLRWSAALRATRDGNLHRVHAPTRPPKIASYLPNDSESAGRR